MGAGSSHKDPFASQVHRLAETAAALRQGGSFPVTRLTVLKKLCQDVRGGTRFLVHLALWPATRWDGSSAAAAPRSAHASSGLPRAPSPPCGGTLLPPRSRAPSACSSCSGRSITSRTPTVRAVGGAAHHHESLPARRGACAARAAVAHGAAAMGYRAARQFAERYDSPSRRGSFQSRHPGWRRLRTSGAGSASSARCGSGSWRCRNPGLRGTERIRPQREQRPR